MNELLWAVTRATALTSIVLLTTTFVLGMLTTARAAETTGGRVVNAALHRTLALLMVCFLSVHIVTAIAETYVNIGWISAVVPFSSTYSRFWIGLGTLGFDIIVALVATSLLRHRLPVRAWRAVHLAAYALWPIALLHGVMSVTADVTLTYAVVAGCTVAGVSALLVRLVRTPPDTARRKLAAAHPWRDER
jgi:methionine sulfoxide reductase heme-binding subunit